MGHLANGVPDGALGSVFHKTLESQKPPMFAFDRFAHRRPGHGSVDTGILQASKLRESWDTQESKQQLSLQYYT